MKTIIYFLILALIAIGVYKEAGVFTMAGFLFLAGFMSGFAWKFQQWRDEAGRFRHIEKEKYQHQKSNSK